MEDKKKEPGNELPKFAAITAIFILIATQTSWGYWLLAFVLWLGVLIYALWQDKKWPFEESRQNQGGFTRTEYHT